MKQPASPAKSADRRPTSVADLPAPRHAALWAAGVFALCTLSLCYPVFAGKFLAMPWSDQYIAGYPFRAFAVESMRSGNGIPQWNPFLYGGIPFIAAMHGDTFYPTVLLRLIFGTAAGMAWGMALHLFLAGMFTYAFLRQWGLGFFPSVVGGIAYMLSGQLAGLASPGHDGKLFSSALFPLLLIMLTYIRDGRRWAYGGFALAVGLAVFSHPQLLEYLLLACFAFGAYIAFGTPEGREKLPTKVAFRRLGLAFGGLIVGGMIGGIQFLPVAEYLPWSPRAGGRDYAYATSFSQPIEEFTINSYLPQFTGMLDSYWGRNGIHLHSEYLGVVVLFLAIAAIGTEGYRGFRRFWLATFIVAVLWSLGGYTPFYRLIYAIVPMTRFVRAPSTIYFIYAFAVAVFAAFGTRRLLALRVSTTYAWIWAGIAAGIALIMTVGGASALAQPVLSAIGEARYPGNVSGYVTFLNENYVGPNLPKVIAGAWRSFLFIGLAAGLLWGLRSGRIPRQAAAWLLAALVAVDLWSIERMYWQFSPPASQVYASDPAIEMIRKADQPGRVVAIDGDDILSATGQQIPNFFPAVSRDPLFDGSGFMAHDVRDLTGYHGNELHRYQTLFLAGPSIPYNASRMLNPGIWRHENVQYFYTTLPDSVMAQLQAGLKLAGPFTRIAGPVRDASGTMVYLYRIPADNPFAWVASGAVRASDEQSQPTVLDLRFDPRRAALVDTGSAIRTADATKLTSSTIATHVASYKPGRIAIDLSAPAPEGAVLVVSENYFPGWKATAGGSTLPTSRANYNLIGVGLTAGTQHIDLTFVDPAYDRGKLMTLIALLIAVGAVTAGIVLDRRRPVASAAV